MANREKLKVNRERDERLSAIQAKVDKEILEKKSHKDKDDIIRDQTPTKHNEKEHTPIAEQPKNKSAYAANNYHKQKKEEREA